LGHVTRIGFFPFAVGESRSLPDDLRLLIANSGDRALKSAGARDVFNQRVACYEFALMLLKRRWPAAAGAERLRDLVPEVLGVEPRDLYHALTLLPDNPSREEMRSMLAREDQAQVERLFGTHSDVGPYNLRGVALFGIAECQRSRWFGSLLATGDLAAIGQFMRASHDGDRCFRTGTGEMVPFTVPVDDAALTALAKANAPLDLQPGAYACSTANIDRLVDIANGVEGVVGAQLAGAGLGGCMMTLLRAEAVATLEERFRQDYYGPLEREPDLHVCLPVAGAGLVSLTED
jgi:galactokinase